VQTKKVSGNVSISRDQGIQYGECESLPDEYHSLVRKEGHEQVRLTLIITGVHK
jgi:hypothetical protein